jgi:hypothetical protein
LTGADLFPQRRVVNALVAEERYQRYHHDGPAYTFRAL